MCWIFWHIVLKGIFYDQLEIGLGHLERVLVVNSYLSLLPHFRETHGIGDDLMVIGEFLIRRICEKLKLIELR